MLGWLVNSKLETEGRDEFVAKFGSLCRHLPTGTDWYLVYIHITQYTDIILYCVWNVMAHAEKPDMVFQQNERVHLNRRGSQFSRLLALEECGSAVVMVVMPDRPCSEAECKSTGYPLHSPVSLSLPLPFVTVCHQVSTEL